jgi:hypothetical protein
MAGWGGTAKGRRICTVGKLKERLWLFEMFNELPTHQLTST